MPEMPIPDGLVPGPLMVDVAGLALSDEDRDIIAHPRVGGVILFARNFRDRSQLIDLIADIRDSRDGSLIIGVDHEGGRVQRFREQFTRIPPMRRYGEYYDQDPDAAITAVADVALLMAWELAQCGIDLTFAPSVDIDHGFASVIGDRALHHKADAVVALGGAVIHGLRQAGFASVMKHFPGHGSVAADTHLEIAVDNRSYEQIARSDMLPFERLVNVASAVMPAHVIYNGVDSKSASLSAVWQTQILREKLQFRGAIVSDDLSMSAITDLSPQSQAAATAIRAGTDLALICNDRPAVLVALQDDDIEIGNQDNIRRRLSLLRKAVVAPDADRLARIIEQTKALV